MIVYIVNILLWLLIVFSCATSCLYLPWAQLRWGTLSAHYYYYYYHHYILFLFLSSLYIIIIIIIIIILVLLLKPRIPPKQTSNALFTTISPSLSRSLSLKALSAIGTLISSFAPVKVHQLKQKLHSTVQMWTLNPRQTQQAYCDFVTVSKNNLAPRKTRRNKRISDCLKQINNI